MTDHDMKVVAHKVMQTRRYLHPRPRFVVRALES